MNKLQPHLFIICGHVGSGKTTTANILGRMINAPVASVDTVLRHLFEKPSFVGKDQIPSPDELRICYEVFALIAEYTLISGSAIIIDGAFAKKAQRTLLSEVAKQLHAPFHMLYITCPEEIMRERATKRFASGQGVGWNAHLQLQKLYEQPLDEPHEVIDTSKDIESQLVGFLSAHHIQ